MTGSGLHLLAVELTSSCNLACAHCYGAFSRQGRSMPLEWAERIAIAGERMGVRVVTVTGGEPLTLGRRLPDYVRPFAERGMRTFLTTNGVGLGGPIGREVLEGLTGVQVSLDGTRETHDRFRGRGTFDAAIRALAAVKAFSLDASAMMTLHAANVGEVPLVAGLCRELGVRLSLERCSPPDPSSRGEEARGEEAQIRVAAAPPEQIFTAYRFAKEHGLHSFDPCFVAAGFLLRGARPPGGRPIQGGCTAGIAALAITPELDVLPCVRVRTPIGNLAERSLESLWTGGALLDRLRDRGSLEGECGACAYAPVCGGCRANALRTGRGLMAEDPSCPLRGDGGGAR